MIKQRLEIILDIDQCLCDFVGGFEAKYKVKINTLSDRQVSKRVIKLKHNTEFWTSLQPLCSLDFTPSAYCTSRINSKYSTKKWLFMNNFPNSPVYQVWGYGLSKVPKLKMTPHKTDYRVFVDDSPRNVKRAMEAGFNALLLDTPYNQNLDETEYKEFKNIRIPNLKYKTIEDAFRRIYF